MGSLKLMGVFPSTSIRPGFHPKGLSPRSKTQSDKINTWIFLFFFFFPVSSEIQNRSKGVLKEL